LASKTDSTAPLADQMVVALTQPGQVSGLCGEQGSRRPGGRPVPSGGPQGRDRGSFHETSLGRAEHACDKASYRKHTVRSCTLAEAATAARRAPGSTRSRAGAAAGRGAIARAARIAAHVVCPPVHAPLGWPPGELRRSTGRDAVIAPGMMASDWHPTGTRLAPTGPVSGKVPSSPAAFLPALKCGAN
jgi:hypothetical protein